MKDHKMCEVSKEVDKEGKTRGLVGNTKNKINNIKRQDFKGEPLRNI